MFAIARFAIVAILLAFAAAALVPQSPGKLLASLKIENSVSSPLTNVFHSGTFFNATRGTSVPVAVVGTTSAIYGIELETYTTVWTAALNDFSGTSVSDAEHNVLLVVSQLCPDGGVLCVVALNMSNAQVLWYHPLGSADVLPPLLISRRGREPVVFTINNYDVVGYSILTGAVLFRVTPSIVNGSVSTICVPKASSDEVAVVMVDNTPMSGVFAYIYDGTSAALVATVVFPNTSATYDTMQPLAACVASPASVNRKAGIQLYVAANAPAQGSLEWSQLILFEATRTSVNNITLLLTGYATSLSTQNVNGKEVVLTTAAWMPAFGTTPVAGRLFAVDCVTFKGINTDMFILPNTLFTAVVTAGATSNLLLSYFPWSSEMTNILTLYKPFPTKASTTPTFNVTLPAVPELNEQQATSPVFVGAVSDKIIIGVFDKRVEVPDKISELFIFIYSA